MGPRSNGNVIGGIGLESTKSEGGIKKNPAPPHPSSFLFSLHGAERRETSRAPFLRGRRTDFFPHVHPLSQTVLAAVVLAHLHCADTRLCAAFEVGAMCSADKDVSSVVAAKLLGHVLLTRALLTEVATSWADLTVIL